MEIKKINNNFIQYHFQINKDDFEILVDKIFDKIKHKVEIKGFRKGFVTRNIFEKHFDPQSLYKDAFEVLIQEKLKEIFQNNNEEYNFIGRPKVIDFKLEDLMKKKDFFNFGLEFVLKPQIQMCNYKDIILKKYNLEVTEEEVQQKINVLLENNPILEVKGNDSSIELGDIVVFDFTGYLNNQLFEGGSATNYTLEIGSNKFIPGFEEGMIGLKKNEEKDIIVKFPHDYAKIELADKEVVFKVLLHEIKRKKSVVLNDELVQNIKLPNINNVQDFKIKLKEELINQKKNEIENKQKEEILDFLIKNSVLEIPQFLVNEEVQNLKKDFEEQLKTQNITLEKYLSQINQTEKKFLEELNEQALQMLKTEFLLDEIGNKEQIQVSQNELEENYKAISNQYKLDIEKLKENETFIKHVKDNLIRQKTIIFLLKQNIKNNIQ
ncbi:trigger factor [Columbia Basin potato purple top phytoplasma]|uniref:Trigger factor n=1 Tax=Columbia Basin potato purple top phytoplasma TaxID=307134 RepID=A0ABT5L9D3_9MOLU|nr:trigger factor [Columbia Basin potato purple top phytoplasma]MDC9031864.1 trigger factor [Columbia Basin potato purple top phytoplasma]